MKNEPMRPLLQHLQRPLLVMCHTQAQLDIFRHKYEILRKSVIRVFDEQDIRGRSTEGTALVLLPGYQNTRNSHEIIFHWKRWNGLIVTLTDDQVLGRAPLCDNDTDGDGDCHLCVRKECCAWPMLQKNKPI